MSTLGPWIYILVATHLTNISTSLYLHRCQAHGGIEIHPLLAVPMRIWIWLTTSANTRQWVAVHRKHHSYTERVGDPHSPKVFGIRKVALTGWWLYHLATLDKETLAKYGRGTPEDWLERKILDPYMSAGPYLLGLIHILVFGPLLGIAFILIMIVWMPICGNIINGIGHHWGYRNTNTKDLSKNIVPWGILIAGEELHNNHHADPRSPRFSEKWFELDIGWAYVKAFEAIGLIKVLPPLSKERRALAEVEASSALA